ncbi:MAG: DUF29 domain-containing protein, partial [Acidobacteriota bacterium]|nr:DUF29 domain-containing protein [Acidobacteriota bacterium]
METTVVSSTDTHQWALDTAAAIRSRRFEGIDWDQVAEEIEDLANSRRDKLESHLAQLIYHLLKMEFQPERHGVSWDISVTVHRDSIYALLGK